MTDQSELERRKELAVEIILNDEGLTDDLTDEEAKILMDWGLRQAEALALSTQEIADQDEARLAIESEVHCIRQAMRRMSRQAGQAQDPLAELGRLLAAEMESGSWSLEVGSWREEIDNAT